MDVVHVFAHGSGRRVRIARNEGGDDRLVMGKRLAQDARRFRSDAAVFNAQNIKRQCGALQERIAGRADDGAMELMSDTWKPTESET